ncbi:MAG: hypothetical protein LAT64_12540 [Phycisphaerales bacterium]|nr:MFS transporter [Planctomycetota bacterium]MCH8509582.1 hypothetical protein [Phycisphaerales bacterium]
MAGRLTSRAHAVLTGEDDGRVCRDIPEEACREQPRNFLIHVLSLGATKTGDGLADPKLSLAWLLTSLGAPAALIGLLVPVREAGSLLPQLITAGYIRGLPRRKWVWAAGSFVQGLAVAGMGAAALTLEGAAAGWAIVGLLAVFALARSVCSVSHKDVLGKTVSKSTRGTATGTAATIAALLVLAFGAALSVGLIPLTVTAIAFALFGAAGLWLIASALFCTLAESPGATAGGGNPIVVAVSHFSLLREDPQLVRFITTRGLLTSTALAPPFILTLAGATGRDSLADLGPFVIASSTASVASTYLWGRLSDQSSRRVLLRSGLIGGAVLFAAAAFGWSGLDGDLARWGLPVLLFVLMIAYQGVRLGRSTHLVDMADADTRAAYTALSNTIIGLILVGASVFGLLGEAIGTPGVLAVFGAMALGAAWTSWGLEEVQQRD